MSPIAGVVNDPGEDAGTLIEGDSPMRRRSMPIRIGPLAIVLLLLAMVAPLSSVAISAQADAGLTGDQSYQSPQWGYEVTWDDPWAADEGTTRSRPDRDDRLVLIHDDNGAELTIRGELTGDSGRDIVDDLIADREDDEDEVVVEDERRRAGRASALLSYTSNSGDVREYVEVSGLNADEGVLLVTLVARAGAFGDALDALSAVAIEDEAVFQDQPEAGEAASPDDPTATPRDEGTVRRRPNFSTGEPTSEPTEDATGEPAETADGADGVDSNTFTSPNFDFSISWDEDFWSVEESSISDASDQLSLNSDGSFLVFQAGTDFNGDVDDCLTTITETLEQGTDDVEITDVDSLEDENGDTIEGSSSDRAYAANLYTATFEGTEEQIVYYVECRTLVEEESELVIFHFVQDPDDYAGEAEARDALLATLETGNGSPDGDDPTATPEDEEPTSTPDGDEDETPEAGDQATFESDTFEFSLSYDPTIWEESGSGDDGLALDDGLSSLTIAAAEEYEGDSVACVQGQLEEIRGFEGITRIDPETGANGRRISGGDSERFFALYRVTASDGTFDGTNDLLVYLECRTLAENDSVISIIHLVFDPDQYEQEAERAEAVLETIEIGD